MATALESHREDSATPERSGQSSPDGPSGAALRGRLRTTQGYESQAALLRPEGGAPTETVSQDPLVVDALAELSSERRQEILEQRRHDLEKMEDRLSYSFGDWAVTDGDVTAVLKRLERIDQASRVVLLQSLEQREQLATRLHENLEPKHRTAYFGATVTLLGLLAPQELVARLRETPPGKASDPRNAPSVAWMMRQVPGATVRQLAIGPDGAAIAAWAAITPAPVKAEVDAILRSAQGAVAERERRAEQAAELDAAAREAMTSDPSFRATIDTIEELLSYDAIDWAVTDGEARQVWRILKGLGDPQRVRMAVRQLDRGGFVDRLLENLPAEVRWADKRTFLALMGARDPAKNVAYVLELLDRGVFDWAVTDEDASLAFQLVQSMPPDVREQFRARDGGAWWSEMEGELSDADRSDQDAHFYENQEQTQALKLAFREGVGSLGEGELRVRIEMLLRMGEVDFVERTLLDAGLDQSAEHVWVYQQYGFATRSAPRDQAKLDAWRDNARDLPETMWPAAGALDGLGALGGAVWAKAGGTTSQSVDLQDVASVLGGTIAGVTVGERGSEDENVLGYEASLAEGFAKIDLPGLNIAAIHRFQDGVRVQTGAGRITNARVDAKWPSEADPSTHMVIELDALEVHDLWLIAEDRMQTATRVALGPLRVEVDSAVGERPKSPDHAIAILMQQLTDTMGRLVSSLPLDTADPATMASHFGQSLVGGMDATVALEAATVEGYGDSAGGGGYVERADVAGVSVRVEQVRFADLMRERVVALEQLPRRTEGQRVELEALKEVLAEMAPLEQRLEELMARQAAPEGRLTAAEREEVQRIRHELVATRSEVRVRSVALSGVDTDTAQAEALALDDVRMTTTVRSDGGDGTMLRGGLSVGGMSGRGLVQKGGHRLAKYDARVSALRKKIDAGRASESEVQQYVDLSELTSRLHAKVVRADELELLPERSPEQAEELAGLRAELEPWLEPGDDARVETLDLRGDGSAPAIVGQLDPSTGSLALRVVDAELTGARQGDGAAVDVLRARGVRVDASGGLLTELAGAGLAADHLRAEGVELRGRPVSETLEAERQQLADARVLDPAAFSEAQARRLAELDGEIARAHRCELELAALRERAASEEGLTPEEAGTLEALAKVYDPKYTRAASIEARDVEAVLDVAQGRVAFQAGRDDAEAPGFVVTGVEQGTVVDGEEVVSRRIERVATQSVAGGLETHGPGVPDMLALSQGADSFAAAVDARGVAVTGYEGDGQRLDSARFDGVEGRMGFDAASGQGAMGFTVQGGEIEGVALEGESRIAGIERKIGALRATEMQRGALTASQQEALETLVAERQKYQDLRAKAEKARGRRQKRRLERKVKAWETAAPTTVERVTIEHLTADLTGLSNPLASDFDPTAGDVGLDLESRGAIGVEGLVSGDNAVDEASIVGLRAQGRDVLDADDRQLAFAFDEATARGVRGKAKAIKKATAKDVSGELNGDNLGLQADTVTVAGAWSGGSGVGFARMRKANVNISKLGSARQSISGSARGVYAAGIKHNGRSRSIDRTRGEHLVKSKVEAKIKKLKGSGLGFSLGPGGTVTASVGQFSGEGLEFEKHTDRYLAGSSHEEPIASDPMRLDLAQFDGKGASFSRSGGRTSISADSLNATGADVSKLAALGGRRVGVGSVNINGLSAQLQDNGDFVFDLKRLAVRELRSKGEGAGPSRVDGFDVTDLYVAQTGGVEQYGFSGFEVRGVHLDEALLQEASSLRGPIERQVGHLKADIDLIAIRAKGEVQRGPGADPSRGRVMITRDRAVSIGGRRPVRISGLAEVRIPSGGTIRLTGEGENHPAYPHLPVDTLAALGVDIKPGDLNSTDTALLVTIADATRIGELELRDFDPTAPGTAGSKLVMHDAQGGVDAVIRSGDSETRVLVEKGKADQIYVIGLGQKTRPAHNIGKPGGMVLVGTKGAEAAKLSVQRDGVDLVDGTNLRDAEGHAGIDTLGNELVGLDLKTAAGKLELKVPPAEWNEAERALLLKKAQEEFDAKSPEERYAPHRDRTDFSVLDTANGTVDIIIPTATGDQVITLPVVDGTVSVNDVRILLEGHDGHRARIPGGVLTALLGGLGGLAAGEERIPLSAIAEWAADKKLRSDKTKRPGSPDEPLPVDPNDFRIRMNVKLGGGDKGLRYGDTARLGSVGDGTHIVTDGVLGDDFEIRITDGSARDVTVAGDLVEVDRVGGTARVRIKSLRDAKKTAIDVEVDGRVEGVRIGGAQDTNRKRFWDRKAREATGP